MFSLPAKTRENLKITIEIHTWECEQVLLQKATDDSSKSQSYLKV
jgi:hypothetical protein